MRPLVLITAFLLVLAGCSIDVNVRAGRQPDVAALDGLLRIGQSTQEDVLAALGPPFGRGRAMLPLDATPRTLWTYTYAAADVHVGPETIVDQRTLLLFVFFEQDRYAGYMWVSSFRDSGRN